MAHYAGEGTEFFPDERLISRDRWQALVAALELTVRQTEIAALLCRAYTNKSICDQLSLSHDTVRMHMKDLFRRLGVRSRTAAVIQLLILDRDRGDAPGMHGVRRRTTRDSLCEKVLRGTHAVRKAQIALQTFSASLISTDRTAPAADAPSRARAGTGSHAANPKGLDADGADDEPLEQVDMDLKEGGTAGDQRIR